MGYQIKQAKTRLDFDAITTLHLDSYSGGIKEIPDLDKGKWWLVWDRGKPIAFAGIYLSHNYLRTAYLCRVAVKYSYRGQGLQKKLLHVRERWARVNGIDWLITETWANNFPSSNSLINCGYKLWQPKYGWRMQEDGIKPLYWKKLLQK